jgi:hypothetical protein
MNYDQEKRHSTEAKRADARKVYEKPAFRYERMFETMALGCGKIIASQSTCSTNRKTS